MCFPGYCATVPGNLPFWELEFRESCSKNIKCWSYSPKRVIFSRIFTRISSVVYWTECRVNISFALKVMLGSLYTSNNLTAHNMVLKGLIFLEATILKTEVLPEEWTDLTTPSPHKVYLCMWNLNVLRSQSQCNFSTPSPFCYYSRNLRALLSWWQMYLASLQAPNLLSWLALLGANHFAVHYSHPFEALKVYKGSINLQIWLHLFLLTNMTFSKTFAQHFNIAM